MSEEVKLEKGQFNKLDLLLEAQTNATWRISDRLAELKDAHRDVINAATEDITKWLAIQNDTISAGFAAVVAEIAKLNKPKHGPPAKIAYVKLVFEGLKENH